jgi:2-C-methyl-D-erythritol 4-phosphate cytidylyltransferase/2-C-methyl-D-erythritol 2,4-cyclodiphosphate synthase
MRGVAIVLPEEEFEARRNELHRLWAEEDPGLCRLVVPGGRTRQESAYIGLKALPAECDAVLIHDAARPFVTPKLIGRVADRLREGVPGVVPGLPVTDTVKQASGDVVRTLPRSSLYAVQTPQGFLKDTILERHEQAVRSGQECTDDASLLESAGLTVEIVPGEDANIKITTPHDLEALRPDKDRCVHCTGWGYDVHRFGPGRPMKLAGVPIDNGPEIVAHSDGDVLLHALIDALLGCLGRGDIGELYPDSDPSLDNASSGILLAEVLEIAAKEQVVPEHVDVTVICQSPRLGPWKKRIKKGLSGLLALREDRIGLKASTEEGMGFTGEGKGIKAVAVVSARKPMRPDPET